MKKEKSTIYLKANNVRTRLLLDMRYELEDFKKNCLTKINRKTIKETDKEYNDIVITINNTYSHRKSKQSLANDYKLFCSFVTKLSFSTLNNSEEDQQHFNDFKRFTLKKKQTISDRKIMNFQINTLKKYFLDVYETRNSFRLKEQPFQLLPTIKEDEVFQQHIIENINQQTSNKIDEIIDYLNVERGFFKNPKTHIRARSSFIFLKSLANSLKILPIKKKKVDYKKQETIGFTQVQNIMLLKENLDESNFKNGVLYENKKHSTRRPSDSKVEEEIKGKILKKISSKNYSKAKTNTDQKQQEENVSQLSKPFVLQHRRRSLITLEKCKFEDSNASEARNSSDIFSLENVGTSQSTNVEMTKPTIDSFKINLICLD
jgi:hypothetical protein